MFTLPSASDIAITILSLSLSLDNRETVTVTSTESWEGMTTERAETEKGTTGTA